MIRPASASLLALLLVGCAAPRENMNNLRIGMTPAEVQAQLGTPDSSSADKSGGQCSYYMLWRDFWNRRPGDYSDRYFVCYEGGRVSSFGRDGDASKN